MGANQASTKRPRQSARTPLLLCVLAACLGAVPEAGSADGTGEWKLLDEDEGIRIWRLEIPGRDMPGFRGRTLIQAPAEQVLSVLQQVDEHEEWMHRCSESRVVRRSDPQHAVVYNRTDAPWPIWDRDVVLDTEVSRQSQGERIVLRFEDTDPGLVPTPNRVVRMPRLEGAYTLVKRGPSRTEVTYQVEVDVGGSVPDWIAERVARDMPFETLKRLRERVGSVP